MGPNFWGRKHLADAIAVAVVYHIGVAHILALADHIQNASKLAVPGVQVVGYKQVADPFAPSGEDIPGSCWVS